MKKLVLLSTMLVALGFSASAQDVYDDIYYNPKKDKTEKVAKKDKTKVSKYYVENFADVDVDAYNRRGESYFYSPIDTIGSGAENGEDFTRTANIQRFYNPTIVIDNADLLEDVLANSYGNVEIVYDGYYPTIVPSYGYYSVRPYYAYSWGYPYWGVSWSNPWGWNIGFGWYDPWYAWGWSPGWYDPWYGWGWGWNPGWGPSWGGNWNYADYRPNGNHRAGAGRDWAAGARPGYGGGGISGAPHRGNSSVSGMPSSRPSTTGVASSGYSSNNHRGYTGVSTNVGTIGNSGTTSHRYNGTFNASNSNRYNTTGNTVTSRPSGNVSTGGNRYGNSSVSSGNHRSNSSTSSSRQGSSYNSGSSYRSGSSGSAGRSSGGFGGGARTGGGGGSRGGGGHR